jgi:phosphonatase-like hydrolase
MVVFDMAGTTVDEGNVVYKTLHSVINKAGIAVTLPQVLASGAGKEKQTALRDIIAGQGNMIDEAQIHELYLAFNKELAEAYSTLPMQPQPGAEALFVQLKEKDIKVVLNTGYNRPTAESILQKLGWQEGGQIDALVTASDVVRTRPHPDMIEKAMQLFGIAHGGQVAKIGDSAIDIEEGKNAGCGLTVGITTGAQTEAQLQVAQPHFIIHHLSALLPLLQAN